MATALRRWHPPRKAGLPMLSLLASTTMALSAGTPRPTATLPVNPADWLLQDPAAASAVVLKQLDAETLELTNGLLSRVFATAPFFATWDLADAHGSVLRGMSAEATLVLDGVTYDVGGAVAMKEDGKTVCPLPSGIGPPDNCPTAYFNRSVAYTTNASAFQYAAHWTSPPEVPFAWTPGACHAPATAWPPLGLVLHVNFTAPSDAAAVTHKAVVVTMHYEMFQGIPAMTKSMTVTLGGAAAPGTSGDVASSSAAADVPPDQQGPICLQPCGATLPPSSWESRWTLDGTSAAPQPIQLFGQEHLCLSVAPGTAYHEYNDQLDARPCNASDTCQLWAYDPKAQTLQTSATAADLNRTLHKDSCIPAGYPEKTTCVVDVNNDQADAGTTLQLGPGPATALWKLVPAQDDRGADGRAGTAGVFHIQSLTFNPPGGDLNCVWHTPLAPPPSPPPPLPKPVCDPASNCTVLGGAQVEILRTNAEYAPAQQAGNAYGDGLLYIRVHGSDVVWQMDPTFDPSYAGNDGAIQPMAGYASADAFGGPGARIFSVAAPGARQSFTTFRVLLLLADQRRGSLDRERIGLSRRRLTRLLAPQTTEAPLFLHLTDVSPAGVKNAVDQMAAVGGFDMLIFSFGSGFNLEDDDQTYLDQMRTSIAYANAQGIEVGGYDLIALSRTGTGFDATDPTTGKSVGSTCFASGWNRKLLNMTTYFMNQTGLSMIETDGPYGGYACGSTDHDHYGADDSVQKQWENQVAFYQEMRRRGVFVHAPDDYTFAGGANKHCGWYQEMQFSLPRWQWLSISHQEMFDEIPTETWMFAPLVDYHSGGPPAALEPFADHIDAWEWTLATHLGAGVGACYRGDRLYDTPAVQAMVTKWTSFWTKYRTILTQDIIHVKRPDLQSVDCIVHVTANKSAPVAALAMVYNPTQAAQNATLHLDLYYTGETGAVSVVEGETGQPVQLTLARDYSISVHAALPPRGISYFVVTRVPAAH